MNRYRYTLARLRQRERAAIPRPDAGLRRMLAPAVFACALIVIALSLTGLFGGGTGSATPAATRPTVTPPMAPVAEHDECEDLRPEERKWGSHRYADSFEYCNEWYDEADGGPPDLLVHPDKWIIFHLNTAAADTFDWWLSAPDPTIGEAQKDPLQTPEEQKVAAANRKPFDWGVKKFMILVIAFSAVGVLVSFIHVARSGDPAAAQRSVRGPVYAVVMLFVTVPFLNANVKTSNAFSKWLIATGLPGAADDGGRDPSASLQVAVRDFLGNFDDENFILKVLFLVSLIIATVVLYLESIMRLFLVIAGAALLPVMASLSGTNYGKQYFRQSLAVLIPLCWLDTVQAVGMVFPLKILDAQRDNVGSPTQSAFIALFGIILVCFMPGALIRVALPIASEVASSGSMNRRLADAIPATGARVVTGAAAVFVGRRK